jgi:hypothetical protein
MPELPYDIKQTFFGVMSAGMDIEAFEQWLYSEPVLADLLSADDYLELISLNYKKSGVKYELFNLLQRFVGAGEYEKWKLIGLLHKAKVNDINLPGTLEHLYDLYCDGYDFLRTLGLGFGLSMVVLPAPRKVEHWSELKADELNQLVKSLPQLIINYEADLVLRWLEEGKVILTGKKDAYGHFEFIDNRSDAEKARIPQYGF